MIASKVNEDYAYFLLEQFIENDMSELGFERYLEYEFDFCSEPEKENLDCYASMEEAVADYAAWMELHY